MFAGQSHGDFNHVNGKVSHPDPIGQLIFREGLRLFSNPMPYNDRQRKRSPQRLMMFVLSKSPFSALGFFFCLVSPIQAEPPGTNEPNRQQRIQSLPPTPAAEIASVFESRKAGGAVEPTIEDSTDSNDRSPRKQIARWIEQLGSIQFAEREQATAGLRAVGRDALSSLKETAANHDDLEVRMRAADVAKGIVQGETAGRIDAFLAGQDVGLEGWPVATKILGDGLRVRELYVDLVMRHEDVAQSLMGSSTDRAQALRLAIVQIQRGMFVERRLPTEADAIALLMLVNDRNVPVNRVDENALFSVLRKEASSLLLRDPQLAEPFRQLLGGWMTRSDTSNRQEMLWFAMSWDLQEARPLVIRTLEDSSDPATLSMAAQAASRFATLEDLAKLKPLLDDERPAAEQQYAGGTIVQAQVRDAAMAAIILLSRKKLSAFGMNDDAFHPKYGFITQEIGFPVDDAVGREATMKQVRTEILEMDSESSIKGESN
jgi:hypothetical protein